MTEDSDSRNHHRITIRFKCPMEGCGLVQTQKWESYEFPEGLEGISAGHTLEGPFHCPDCEERGTAHSNMFEVVSVEGEPVNTDFDPLGVEG